MLGGAKGHAFAVKPGLLSPDQSLLACLRAAVVMFGLGAAARAFSGSMGHTLSSDIESWKVRLALA